MSHVRCPFAAGFPARRGSRARSPIRRGLDRRVPTASPTHIQPSLPLTLPRRRAGRPRQRGLSGPFLPAEGGSPYRLPREASERLALALTPARNREAAFTLARFLARFWSTPSRLLTAFPIDRRALANRPDLGLTEAQVRGAVRALETVGFSTGPCLEKGSAYRAVGPAGELHRKPVLFRFGSEYAPLFAAANKRAAAARGGRERARRQKAQLQFHGRLRPAQRLRRLSRPKARAKRKQGAYGRGSQTPSRIALTKISAGQRPGALD